MKKIIILIILFSSQKIWAQDSILKTLSATAMMQIVKLYHPIAKQADISIEKSKADVLYARGMFDPELKSYAVQKEFEGTNYYTNVEPMLSIPTWYGIEFNTGVSFLEGTYTDPTKTLGQTSYMGITVPLLKNLVMDKRRAALKTAKIFRSLSEVEKRTVINELMLDAMKAYWQWVKLYELYKIVSDAVTVNEKRIGFVKTAFQLGERPAIDTTEALAQLQSFMFIQNELLLQYNNATLDLSLYLWQQNEEPYVLGMDVIPENGQLNVNINDRSVPALDELLSIAQINHPKIVEFNYKLQALDINRQLKFQEMLPSLNLSYNQLGEGYNIFKTAGNLFSDNNYLFGVSFSMPLRFSEGRGSYRSAKLKINETKLSQDLTRATIINKVKSVFNELLALKQQVMIQTSAYNNYQSLQRGEEARFLNGESSLFLINTRENKRLEVLQKLTELKAKYFETEIKLQWAAGIL